MTKHLITRALVVLAFAGAWLGAPQAARAAEFHVDLVGGDDGNDGASWPTARRTIGSALASAEATPEDDIIRVAEGVYFERIRVPPEVTLLGGFPRGGGSADPSLHETVIDGELEGTVVELGPGTDGSVVDGFTIRHGFMMSEVAGGGITITEGSPTIRRCIIERNAGYFGGGVHVRLGTPLFEDCVIRENVAARIGAAIHAALLGDDPRTTRLRRMLIENNACNAPAQCRAPDMA